VVYAINAAATLVCLTLIALVRSRQAVHSTSGDVRSPSLLAGFKFVYRTKIIPRHDHAGFVRRIARRSDALPAGLCKDILHAGPTGLGILQAALPLGSVVSALYLAHRPPLQRAGHALIRASRRSVWRRSRLACPLVLAFVRDAVLFCGVVDNVKRRWCGIRWCSLLTPDEMRGRVLGGEQPVHRHSNELGGFESQESVPTPPATTETTGQTNCRYQAGFRNPPQLVRGADEQAFTAEPTRPRILVSVSNCTSVCRTTTLTLSTTRR